MIDVPSKRKRTLFRLVVIILVLLSACLPDSLDGGDTDEAATNTPDWNQYEQPPIEITSAGLEWKHDLILDCTESQPSSEMKICLKNNGAQAVEVGPILFTVPVFIQGMSPPPDNEMLGDRMLADLAAKGIVIINGIPGEQPPPDDNETGDGFLTDLASRGIIIISNMPGDQTRTDDNEPGDGFPADLASKGIIIISNMPGDLTPTDDEYPPDPGVAYVLQQASQGVVIGKSAPAEDGSQNIIVLNNTSGGPAGENGGHPPTPSQEILEALTALRAITWNHGSGGESGGGIYTYGIIIIPGEPYPCLQPCGCCDLTMSLTGNGVFIPGFIPEGFDMIEGMVPMMGDAGFGPGLYLFGGIHLQSFGFPDTLQPGEEICIQFDPGIIAQVLGHNAQPQYETELISMNLTGEGLGQGVLLQFGSGNENIFVPAVDLPKICTPTPTPTPTSTPSFKLPAPTKNPKKDKDDDNGSCGFGPSCP